MQAMQVSQLERLVQAIISTAHVPFLYPSCFGWHLLTRVSDLGGLAPDTCLADILMLRLGWVEFWLRRTNLT